MIYKKLDETYIDDILALQKDIFPDGWNKNVLKSSFVSGRFNVTGAFYNKKLIGFISYSFSTDTADIEDVLVLPEFRHKGVGFFLMEKAEEDAKNNGKNKVFLEVRKSNKIAIGLYCKRNFLKISERAKYYSDGETAEIYCKEI